MMCEFMRGLVLRLPTLRAEVAFPERLKSKPFSLEAYRRWLLGSPHQVPVYGNRWIVLRNIPYDAELVKTRALPAVKPEAMSIEQWQFMHNYVQIDHATQVLGDGPGVLALIQGVAIPRLATRSPLRRVPMELLRGVHAMLIR